MPTTHLCPYCNSKNIKKQGTRKNKFQIIQKYFCKDCNKNFTNKKLKYKTYPPKIILNAISYHNLGHTQSKVSKLLNQRFKTKVPQRTISEWLKQYKNTCTYNKLRPEATKLHSPKNIIKKQTLNHIQPYTFKYHKAKLYQLFHHKLYNNQFNNISKFYQPLKSYLNKIPTEKFPHHIFTYQNHKNPLWIFRMPKKLHPASKDAGFRFFVHNNKKVEQRASQLKFNYLKITHLSKTNLANKLTKLALNLAKTNKQRHETIQNFFLINDSSTIATELPVYLTNDDIYYFKKRGFTLNLENYNTPITGHIDILQVRNSLIHILDYKPEATKTNPIQQLTIYALALASRTKLDLRSIKCAWFDENNYYEFFPLHAVFKKRAT